MAIAFKKNDMLSAGLWKDVQFFEEYGLRTRSKRDSKHLVTPELAYTHLESPQRFTLYGFLKRKHTQGFWWHMVTAHTEVSAWPFKITAFLVVLIFSSIYVNYFYMVPLIVCSWVIFRIYTRKGRVRFCISKYQDRTKKIMALFIIIIVFLLEDLALELGKLHAVTYKILGVRTTSSD